MKRSPFRRLTATCAASAIILVGALSAAPATAATSALSSADESAMRDTWNAYGVSRATQDRLLEALEAGRSWDSLDGATPVTTTTGSNAGSTVTVDTFADGSIRVDTLQVPAHGPTRASIGSCKTLSSSHYDATIQCTVSTNVVVSTAGYAVTYHQVQGGNSRINSVTPITASCYGGTCGSKSVTVNRKTQIGSSPAYSTGRWKWTGINGAGSKDFWLEIDVRGSSTWSANN